jgi:flavin reductase (DIM6/NTAB) family NADH-FMN oxidoreductase RutF
MGPKTLMYPMPTVLLGANVGGKPNYMTAAWCGMACMAPPMISVAVNKVRHTLKGIEENRTFSINVPSTRDLVKTDYMGIASGARVDKSKVFESFYGKLKTAPMAKECPVSLECRLFDAMKCGSHDLVVGEIVETYVDKEAITGGTPDIRKVDPIIYSDAKYYRIGDFITDAYTAGKAYKKK